MWREALPTIKMPLGILPALMFFKFDPRISLGGLARQSLALAT